jgi:N-acetylglucosamine-6-phosphate deacetylase
MRTLQGRIARPDGSIFAGRIRFDDTILSIEPADAASSDFILPGFVDLQVNGSHGIDVMRTTADGILEISEKLAREGATAWLPTAITSSIENIEEVHRAISGAIERQERGGCAGARVLGMHLEGPFISPKRLGAHPKLNLEPHGVPLTRVTALEQLKLITLAPELPGAIEAIRMLTSRGVIVSIGHTDATFEQTAAGVAAGAAMFTHLFNAMRPINQRDPGVITAALTSPRAIPAVIADGVHLDPEILRLIYQARGATRMIVTTDKVSLAGTHADVSPNLGHGPVRIDNGAARLPDGTIAGSIITMLDAMRLMIEKVGASVGQAALMVATNPASLLGRRDLGRLQTGAVSDIIVLGPELKLKSVFLAGRELS